MAGSTGQVGIGEFHPLQKQGGTIRFDGQGNAILPWTETMDFSMDSTHDGYLNLSDKLIQTAQIHQYFTRAQLETAKNNVIAAFRKIGMDPIDWKVFLYGGDDSLVSWPAESETDGKYAGFQFSLTKDIPKGGQLRFSYESTALVGSGKQPLLYKNQFGIYHRKVEAEIPYPPRI